MTTNPTSPIKHEIVSMAFDGDLVTLCWSDSMRQDIHPAFLRHAPGFPGGERPAGPTGRFPAGSAGLAPCHGEITASGDLQLDWQPGDVKSLHPSAWLRDQLEVLQLHGQSPPGQVVWDAARIEELVQPTYAELAQDESARLRLFEQVLNWGLNLVREVPSQAGTVETVAGWFGQIQPSRYADDPARPVVSSIRIPRGALDAGGWFCGRRATTRGVTRSFRPAFLGADRFRCRGRR